MKPISLSDPSSMLERGVTVRGQQKVIFLKVVLTEIFYKFHAKVTLTARSMNAEYFIISLLEMKTTYTTL